MPVTEQSIVDDLVAEKGALVTAAVGALKNPQLWISVAAYLYKEMTKITPLEKEDLARYHQMCVLYNQCNLTDKIPKEWALNEKNCPTYGSDFATKDAALRNELTKFKGCNNHNLKTQIYSIVRNISRLFESLSKRVNFFLLREKYRPDGFESMFLNELAMWAVIELPRYEITDRTTADIVDRRIKYCQDMQDKVLVFRKDHDIANPKNILPAIIKSLERLKQKLSQAHLSASFSAKTQSIDNHITEMVRGTFNILHLMLDQVDQQEFQVSEFLEPGEGRKKKNDIFKQTLLGQWIVQTCEVTGISDNDYLDEKVFPHELIGTHINFDCSTVEKMDQIGWTEFVWRTDYQKVFGPTQEDQAKTYLRDQAPRFLGQVIELHRSILALCYIRRVIAIGKQLSIAYGESWLFARKEGRPMFEGLMDALTHVVDRHADTLNQFWLEFFTNTYKPFADKNHKDSKDKTYTDMMESLDFYKNNLQQVTDIKMLITETHHHADKVDSGLEKNKEKKQMLLRQLYAYLSNVPGYDKGKLAAIHSMIVPTMLAAPKSGVSSSVEPVVRAVVPPAVAALSSKTTEDNIRRSQWLATVTLVQHGGYSPEKIPMELLDDTYQYFMITPDTAETELDSRKAKYEAALATAKAHKLTLPAGAAMPITETAEQAKTVTRPSTDLVFTKESIKTAIMLKEAFEMPIAKFPSDFVPLSILTPLLHRLQGLHLLIYKNVLEPYSGEAGSSFISFWHAYSDEQWTFLRKHHSRMTCALEEVARAIDLYKPSQKVQLELINLYLVKGLREMFTDMPWMKVRDSAKLIVTMLHPASEPLEELPEGRVRVISPEVAVSVARAETVQALAAAAKDRAATKKAIEVAEKAIAEGAKDRAEMHRVIQTMQEFGFHRGQPTNAPSFSAAGSPGLFAPEIARAEGQEDTFEKEPGCF